MQTSTEDSSNLRYLVCVRCNKRHTHKRFQGKKPHTDVPSDWKEVIGFYTNKHTGKPIALKDPTTDPIMCHSCHKQYVNRCNKRPSPSSQSPVPFEAKRQCRVASELTFDDIVDVFLYISTHPASEALPKPITT